MVLKYICVLLLLLLMTMTTTIIVEWSCLRMYACYFGFCLFFVIVNAVKWKRLSHKTHFIESLLCLLAGRFTSYTWTVIDFIHLLCFLQFIWLIFFLLLAVCSKIPIKNHRWKIIIIQMMTMIIKIHRGATASESALVLAWVRTVVRTQNQDDLYSVNEEKRVEDK